MKILVTGATGFIGSFLVQDLQSRGYEVTALVHRKASVLPGWQRRIAVAECDLSQSLHLEGCFDVVVHAAGLARSSGFSFVEYKYGNIDVMENLLAWAQQGHARRVIYLSAMSVYGDINVENVDEQTPIVNPSAYGLSKYVAERLLAEAEGIEHLALRLPGVFGRHAKNPWLATVVEKCIHNQPITIHSPEFVNNNYLYLPDLAEFIETLLHSDWPYQELVLGLQQGVSIREAVDTVRRALGSASEVNVVEASNNPFRINITLAESMGYWSHNFQSMIDKCLRLGGWN